MAPFGREVAPVLAGEIRTTDQEPHWNLANLTTDPGAQGRGIGSALISPIFERCDRDGIVAYTETQKEANEADLP